MTEQLNPAEKSIEAMQLTNDVISLKDHIARANLASNPNLHFPIENLHQLSDLNPIIVIDSEIDFPESGNRASIQISGKGEWLLDNGESHPGEFDHVLEDYALATRDDYVSMRRDHWKERKSASNDFELEMIDAKYHQMASSYVDANRIPLLKGLKTHLEATLSKF